MTTLSEFFQKHHFKIDRDGETPLYNTTLKLALIDAHDHIKSFAKNAKIFDLETGNLVFDGQLNVSKREEIWAESLTSENGEGTTDL